MTPDVVVDIGNSRMKWGRCIGGRVTDVVRLLLDDPGAWDTELAALPAPRSLARKWAVASVNPSALDRFLTWSSNRGSTVAVFEKYTDLPIRLNVDEPARVGLDRLCGAVAAKAMVPPGTPAITVDVGTAVTVNLIDTEGVFQGGAIMPGPRLMGRALHDFTAKLPLIDLMEVPNTALGKNTTAAIRTGIYAALIGGIHGHISAFADECSIPPWLFLTGGGHHLIAGYQADAVGRIAVVPTLTLEGIRIAAEALP